eukprot:1092155-Rhodomonas_salina.2
MRRRAAGRNANDDDDDDTGNMGWKEARMTGTRNSNSRAPGGQRKGREMTHGEVLDGLEVPAVDDRAVDADEDVIDADLPALVRREACEQQRSGRETGMQRRDE